MENQLVEFVLLGRIERRTAGARGQGHDGFAIKISSS